MNKLLKNSLRFVLFLLVQTLILNQIEIGFGIQLMIYPLFIMLLSFDTGVLSLLAISFTLGICIDAFSNTFGLHTSSLLVFSFLRPVIFKLFDSREGYDLLLEPTVLNMGNGWFIKSFGSLLLIHHFWFYLLEMFKLNDMGYVLQKTVYSLPLSFFLCVLLQYLFVNKQYTK
ncbi:hypothetical protein N9963_01520 [Crocinitomicaceae bacterium]|nr:hypothetical protein [Crocinitomicaceae bacterium]